jgi:uncharacterized protein YukE
VAFDAAQTILSPASENLYTTISEGPLHAARQALTAASQNLETVNQNLKAAKNDAEEADKSLKEAGDLAAQPP